MLPANCWSGTLLLQLLAIVAAGSNTEAKSEFESSAYRPVAPTICSSYVSSGLCSHKELRAKTTKSPYNRIVAGNNYPVGLNLFVE